MSESERRPAASATPWLVGGILVAAFAGMAGLAVWSRPPGAAILLLVDKSGSMAGNTIRDVRKACVAVGERLRPDDSIGVLAFDLRPRWVVPFSRIGKGGELRNSVDRLSADGGSALYPALVEALRAFESGTLAQSARVKHLLLLSDGETLPADFEGVVKALAGERVTVSTVCLGSGDGFDAPLMSRIAEWGGGKFSFVDHSRKLRALFLRDVDLALSSDGAPSRSR